MNNIRKAVEQSLEQVRELDVDEMRDWLKCKQKVGTDPEAFPYALGAACGNIHMLLGVNDKQATTIDTLLDVIDAYEAEHEAFNCKTPTVARRVNTWLETEAAKATALARLK